MTVAELIKQLQACHPQGEVVTLVDKEYEPLKVEIINRQLIFIG